MITVAYPFNLPNTSGIQGGVIVQTNGRGSETTAPRPTDRAHDRLTQDGDHLIVLDDLERPRHDEAQGVHALADVEDEVAGRAVRGLELHGQRAQAAVAGQPEGQVVVEHLAVQVDTDVRPHIFGTNGENLRGRSMETGQIKRCDEVHWDTQLLHHKVE